MENNVKEHPEIKGWNVDADPENEPTYPMKKYTGDDHQRLNWERPPQQPIEQEVLMSIERPVMTATFGTSSPPSGLSGKLRRYAFQYSESRWMHWLPLILADRINMVEGIVDDLKRGHVPNIFAERGWNAEWKYNKKAFVKKIAITAVLTIGVIALLSQRKKKRSWS